MKRVAALYDIHGNLPALESVLAEVHVLAPDLVLVGGDVVPGPMPAECMEALEALPFPLRWIRGNGEAAVVSTAGEGPPARVPEAFHDTLRWVAGRTPVPVLQAMASWPLTERLRVDALGDVLFCHATPRDDDEIFTVNTPAEALAPAFDDVTAGIVVCGHTHMPFDRHIGGTRVVNAGSVGMPFGDTVAQWLVLDGDGVTARRTEYDLGAARARIEATGYPLPMDLEHPPTAAAMLAAFDAAAPGRGQG